MTHEQMYATLLEVPLTHVEYLFSLLLEFLQAVTSFFETGFEMVEMNNDHGRYIPSANQYGLLQRIPLIEYSRGLGYSSDEILNISGKDSRTLISFKFSNVSNNICYIYKDLFVMVSKVSTG